MTNALEQARRFFEARDWEKGRRVAESGLVLSWEVEEHPEFGTLVIGHVASEARRSTVYLAMLTLGPGSSIEQADCSCPVGSDCKHCAALAQRFLSGGPASLLKAKARIRAETLANEERSDPLKDQSSPELETFDLSAPRREQPASPLAALNRALGLGLVPAHRPIEQRWAPAFCLRYSRGGSGSLPDFVIRKQLRYLKKDGQAGRLGAWDSALLSASPSQGASRLLARFASDRSLDLPLADALDILGEDPSLDLSLDGGSGEGPRALKLLSFASLRLRFPPRRWDERQALLSFGVATRLEGLAPYRASGETGSGQPSAGGAPEPDTAEASLDCEGAVAYIVAGRLAVLDPERGILAIGESPELALGSLAHLISASEALPYGAIVALEKSLSQAAARGGREMPLSVELPPARLVLRRAKPKAELAIHRVKHASSAALLAELSFSYEGKLFGTFQAHPFPQRFVNDASPGADGDFSTEGDALVFRPRDPDFEQRLALRVISLLSPLIAPGRRREYSDYVTDRILLECDEHDFLAEYAQDLLDAGLSLRFEDARLERGIHASATLRLEPKGSWFEGSLLLKDAAGKAGELKIGDPAAIFDRGYARIDGSIWLITPEDRARLKLLLDRWDRGKQVFALDKADFSRLEAAAAWTDEEGRRLLEERLALGRTLAAAFARPGAKPAEAGEHGFRIPAEPLPRSLRAELRPYQKEGYDRLCYMYAKGLSALLADDMGLGKTLQTLALLARLKEKRSLGQALVVVPLTLLSNWEAEAARFAPKLAMRRHHGPARPAALADHGDFDLLITTYQTLRADIELFQAREWGFLAMDEAQTVKNPDAAAFAAIKRIKAGRRLSITGTPVENRPLELWAQFDLIQPGLLDSRKRFELRYSKPIAAGGKEAAQAATELRGLVSPFIIRRRKADVLPDLPPKEEIVRPLEMGPKQAAIYETLRARAEELVKEAIKNGGAKRSAITVFEALLRLRQAAIHPGLISDKYDKAGSAKFDFLAETLEALVAEGHRILVFSQFVQVLARAEALLQQQSLAYEYLDGATRDRAAALKRFKEGDAPVFLLSLKSGGLGVNLPEADYVILLDPWWNPAVEAQAIDRAHRIGQRRPVTIFKPIAAGTVEESILELQERKRGMVNDLIAEDAAFYGALSEGEILGLFSG